MKRIDRLRRWFDKKELPEEIKISKCETITNPREMINTHLDYIERNLTNNTYMPYYRRLMMVKEIIESNYLLQFED